MTSDRKLATIGALARNELSIANDARIRDYGPRVDAINAMEQKLASLSDEALRARTEAFKAQLTEGKTLGDNSSERNSE